MRLKFWSLLGLIALTAAVAHAEMREHHHHEWRRLLLSPQQMVPFTGYAFYVYVDQLHCWADSMQDTQASEGRLLENGLELGPPHSQHASIQRYGGGQFSHWFDGTRTYVVISSSDRSDPRYNGRQYIFECPER
jgi:hypothetical protein